MNKSFIKGFVCGVIATILMILFIKIAADAVVKTADYETRKSESYASEMEEARRENEGLPR